MSSPAAAQALDGLDLSSLNSPLPSEPLDVARLFRESRRELTAFALRFVRDHSEAEDIVQQAFLNAYRARHSYSGKGSPKSWLYTITNNTALMVLRSRRRKPADATDDLDVHDSVDGALDGWSPASEANPELNVSRARIRVDVDHAVQTLPDLDQDIVRLRLEQGLSTREVAAATGISEAAVKTRLYRARATLQQTLAPKYKLAA